jgi:hypothetical protein
MRLPTASIMRLLWPGLKFLSQKFDEPCIMIRNRVECSSSVVDSVTFLQFWLPGV